VLDNFSSGRRENLAALGDKVELIDGDIRDYWTAVQAVDGMDYVLHQAALPSVPRSIANPLTSHAVNIDGTLHVLEAARRAGVKKLVMASSSSIYGESEELPKHEGMEPSPLSPYAITKLTCEHYLRVYWELYQFPTVSLRYFNIFGPRQDPGGDYAAVIPKWIIALLNGQQPVVFGDGEQSRDFTYIDNCVQANILAATNESIVGDQFNVACGGQFTLNQLLDKLREIIGVDIQAHYTPPRQGDILHSYAAIDKLEQFGYKSEVGFDEGLHRTVEFFRSQVSEKVSV
ncbi:MAG: NAD-dependent epimerase/dehydratase family protein, partial [candidate division Zixibacteria bacterium]|nr:NAD-dependent epimerase/dehydratase family protein [candidate division Zixibacteria bacterium]